ncbi:MAG: hypothetical protein WCI73_02965 [Phycisphaerae bacterium]
MHQEIVVLATLLFSLCLTLRSQAQITLDRASADSLVYNSWRGTAALGPDYEQSSLKGLMEACKAPQRYDDLLVQVIEKSTAKDSKSREGINILHNLRRRFSPRPTAHYLGGLDMTTGSYFRPELDHPRLPPDGASADRFGRVPG